jgi:trans-aconitate 2-methyltransferase
VTEELLARLPDGQVIALDASEAMLGQARARLAFAGPRARFVHCDLLDLSPAHLAPDMVVDAVLSTATFHWVTDHDRLFANLRAALRPGGQLVAQCGGEGNIARLIATVRGLGPQRAGTWLYASAAETADRLLRAGFVDVETWCHPELVRFDDRQELVEFLQTVCLREHLGTLPEPERRPFAERVADAMPEPVLDYVRLNMTARRAGGPKPAP